MDAMRASNTNSIIDGDKMFELKSTLERQEKYLHRIMEQRVEDYSARRELLIKELSIKLVVMSSPSEIRICVSQI